MDLVNKVVDNFLKAVFTFLLGGAGYQFLDGQWFGRAIFAAYLRRQNARILTPPSSNGLYSALGAESLSGSVASAPMLGLVLSLLILLAFIAHILFKPVAQNALTNSPSANRNTRLKKAIAATSAGYRAFYLHITLTLFLALVISFFVQSHGLVQLFILIIASAGLYLVMYSKDAVHGSYGERVVYFSIAVLMLVSFIGWPGLYGSRVYDPKFVAVSIPGAAPDRCSDQLQRGPIFVASDGPKKEQNELFRLCFQSERDLYLDFFTYDGQQSRLGTMSFSDALRTTVGAVPLDEAADINDIRGRLRISP